MKPITSNSRDYTKINKTINLTFFSAISILSALVLRKHLSTPESCTSPSCMCDAYTDDDGKRHKAKCCHPTKNPCQNPDQDKKCNYIR